MFPVEPRGFLHDSMAQAAWFCVLELQFRLSTSQVFVTPPNQLCFVVCNVHGVWYGFVAGQLMKDIFVPRTTLSDHNIQSTPHFTFL